MQIVGWQSVEDTASCFLAAEDGKAEQCFLVKFLFWPQLHFVLHVEYFETSDDIPKFRICWSCLFW